MIDFEPIITRRDPPPPPPVFRCVVCQRQINEGPVFAFSRLPRHDPPICTSCALHWGSSSRPVGITRGDHRALTRLKALINRLSWETING